MGYADYPDIQPPMKMNQKPSISTKAIQAKTSTPCPKLVSSMLQPKQSYKKQSPKKSKGLHSNLISEETLQLIHLIINCISWNLSLSEDNPVKPQKVYVELYNEHGHSKVTIIDKEHSLPTTKEYILKEYRDVLGGIWTQLRPAYHIELK